jgi:hypothetical protein
LLAFLKDKAKKETPKEKKSPIKENLFRERAKGYNPGCILGQNTGALCIKEYQRGKGGQWNFLLAKGRNLHILLGYEVHWFWRPETGVGISSLVETLLGEHLV